MKINNIVKTISAALIIAATVQTAPAFASTVVEQPENIAPAMVTKGENTGWVNMGAVWRYYDANGKCAGWKTLNGDTYFLNEYGDMTHGYQPIESDNTLHWYYLSEDRDTYGVLQTGWQNIHNTLVYFGTETNDYGKLYMNETTPDGHQVDEVGRFVK